ncbi:MAG: hypothetical protein EOP56_12950 [Sphingobacteriales bacterium]|nr:MAG: hypothetical protein EOP56_12950 [Sphingobacteriales bacterium]
MIPSVWRCFYYPPAARDILSGPEPLAEYTVREHKMINSVFSLDLWGTNNQHKPPFIWGLQVIYKLFVHQFGQLWLSILVLSFLTWLYCVLRDKIHPLFVGGIMLYFIAMPDPYGYTYIILYDYSNMILFALAVYYLVRHLMSKEMNLFYFSAFLFGLATLIRSETLIFAGMFYPLLLLVMIKDKVPMPKMAWRAGIFILPSFFFYYAWIGIFLKYYMPGGFELDNQVTTDWANVAPLFTRMKEIITVLLFSKNTNFLYGHIHFVFLVVFVADCVIYRRFDKVRLFFLYAIAVVYIGLPVMGYITPLFDLVNTTKRGMYKIFPIMVFYMANSPLLLKWSGALRSYEQPATKDVVKPQPVAAVNHPSIKNKKTGRATRR